VNVGYRCKRSTSSTVPRSSPWFAWAPPSPSASSIARFADDERTGFVKVVTARGTDRILDATIAGKHAGELIAPFGR
jgi:hypothetical protein